MTVIIMKYPNLIKLHRVNFYGVVYVLATFFTFAQTFRISFFQNIIYIYVVVSHKCNKM